MYIGIVLLSFLLQQVVCFFKSSFKCNRRNQGKKELENTKRQLADITKENENLKIQSENWMKEQLSSKQRCCDMIDNMQSTYFFKII